MSRVFAECYWNTPWVNTYLLDDSGSQAVYGFELPLRKWGVKLDDVLLQKG